jgi:hypothetical protein
VLSVASAVDHLVGVLVVGRLYAGSHCLSRRVHYFGSVLESRAVDEVLQTSCQQRREVDVAGALIQMKVEVLKDMDAPNLVLSYQCHLHLSCSD